MSRNEVSETKEATKLVKMGDLSRVGKRLAYVLRYGALKEGLQLYPGGEYAVSIQLQDSCCKGRVKNTCCTKRRQLDLCF